MQLKSMAISYRIQIHAIKMQKFHTISLRPFYNSIVIVMIVVVKIHQPQSIILLTTTITYDYIYIIIERSLDIKIHFDRK